MMVAYPIATDMFFLKGSNTFGWQVWGYVFLSKSSKKDWAFHDTMTPHESEARNGLSMDLLKRVFEAASYRGVEVGLVPMGWFEDETKLMRHVDLLSWELKKYIYIYTYIPYKYHPLKKAILSPQLFLLQR